MRVYLGFCERDREEEELRNPILCTPRPQTSPPFLLYRPGPLPQTSVWQRTYDRSSQTSSPKNVGMGLRISRVFGVDSRVMRVI